VAARGFRLPYTGFAGSNTLAQALRPYPQFNASLAARNASLGRSWYDSLQIKATQRFNRGLDFTTVLTWAKDLDATTAYNDAFNRQNQKRITGGSQPLVLTFGFNYETQKWFNNKVLAYVTSGWTLGGLLRYSSGTVIGVPVATNLLNSQIFQNTVFNRVEGQDLFKKDLDCHCFDPNKDLLLNSAAWVNPDQGKFGVAAAAYSNYRTQRVPDEQLSLGRVFRIREGMSFSVRAEFFNVFNRTVYTYPASFSATPTATPTFDSAGNLTGGFGFVNANNNGQPRNGQLVGRLTF